MKERLLNIIKIAVALIAFLTLSSILALGIKHMGFAITDYKDAVIITSAAEVILAVLIFVLYNKDLIQDRNVVKEKDFIKKIIKYSCMFWGIKIISSVVMAILCVMCGYEVNVSENQEAINLYTTSAPILMLLTTSITTPIVEEGIFRLGISKIIKNKYLFIITSGIFFGFLHIFPTDLNIVYALINSIPYVTMGMVLAYIYKNEDNIYYPMILHGLNNFISMILFFCSWKNKKILYNRKKFWCYYERFIRKFNGVYLFT